MKNEEKFNTGFKSCENKGFQITFENGWTISVQWAEHNYSQRTDRPSPEESMTAECAVWDHKGDWFKLTGCDDVQGWMSPDEVAALITRVAAFDIFSDILDEEDTTAMAK